MNGFAEAEESPLWIDTPHLSDGKQIAFSYQGDVFLVKTQGGLARALTQNDAWDGHPVWSRTVNICCDDRRQLSIFSRCRLRVDPRRLTYHSSDIQLISASHDTTFSPRHGVTTESSIFPTSRLAELYELKLRRDTADGDHDSSIASPLWQFRSTDRLPR